MTSSRDACRRGLAGLRTHACGEMAAWLREHLFGHVLPFWQRHAIDPAGGLLTCLADDGTVLSTDKWLWSQWRAVWVFSRIFNRLDPDPRWRDLATSLAEFCLRSGWTPQGWALVVDRAGRVLRGAESTYVDAFAVYGLSELYRATAHEPFAAAARRTADHALAQLAGPRDRLPHFPYPVPGGAKSHGVPMLWSLSFAELDAALDDVRYREAAVALAREVMTDFRRLDRDLLLEFVTAEGAELHTPRGRAVVPGHAIESMWFQWHVAQLTGRAVAPVAEIFRLVLRHLQLGWDGARGGGLRLAIDADGAGDVAWDFADTKLWWPHTEALYATLLGWRETREPAFLEWHELLWETCLEHFADWRHGEWRQKLDRDFRPIDTVVALPVKDPFHLPRSLILQIELLERGSAV